MTINKLSTVAQYWRVENLSGVLFQNTIIQNRFCEILQNLHFSYNTYDDKTDRGFKVRSVRDHLNKRFGEVLSNNKEQINKHMVKFKERSDMKQYIKSKPIKWGFQIWFRCSSKTGYLYKWIF